MKRIRQFYQLGRILNLAKPQFSQQFQPICTTTESLRKKGGENKKKAGSSQSTFVNADDNIILQSAIKKIETVEKILAEELARHFSLKVDIRQYEDILVKQENGKDKPMSHLARVTLKSPLMVMINFQDNPSAIKSAKLAIQKSTLNVTPQQEGAVLYINIPPMSRERREKMASDAKGRILNEYKKALNEIYSEHDKKSNQEFGSRPDEVKKTRQSLLNLKHGAEQRGAQLIEERRQQLLKQVV